MDPDELEFAASCTRWLDSMIDKANEAEAFAGGSSLYGFDLQYLAEHFDKAADKARGEKS